MINSSLFFLRQCESLDWSDCLVVLLLSATHFRKSGHARLIRGCFSFSQCFRAGVFSSLSPPPPRSLWLAPSPPLFGKFQHGAFTGKLRAQRKRLHCRLNMTHVIYIYVLFCSVRTSSLADIQAPVFLLTHSQNVNWITRAQINPRREKMQMSFYINQFHLWNNSTFLESICLFYSVHVSLFVYLFSFICIYLF